MRRRANAGPAFAFRPRKSGPRTDAGMVLLEFVAVLPFLCLVAFGVTDFGLAWQDRLTVQTATRSGARTGSALGTTASADRDVLLGVGAALQDMGLTNVNWVLVYKSTTSDGGVPSACLSPAPHAVSGSCNAYAGADLQQVVAGTSPASWFGCGAGSRDASWCPTSRQTIQAIGTDYFGVWVSARHPMLTGFFGSVLTMTDHVVMRLEPTEG